MRPTASDATASDWGRRRTLAVALGLLVVGATYIPTLAFEFVSWDDPAHVTENPLVVGGEEVTWRDQFMTPALGYPMPVTMLTYRIEHALFGLEPLPYHATNIFLHLAACLFVFLIARRLGLGDLGALAALLLFGLHPIVCEPVAWITGRKDLLAAVFSLWTVHEALRLPLSVRRPRTWGSMLLFVLACLSKPVAFFVPLALVAIHVLNRRERLRVALGRALPYFLIPAIIFPVAMIGQQATGSLREVGLADTLRQAWYALGFHLGLLSFVQTSSAKYLPHPWPPPFAAAVDLFPFAVAATLALLVRWVSAARRPVLLTALVFAALAYLPSSNLIPLTRFAADVYLYLPLAGLAWFVGGLVEEERGRLLASNRRYLGLGVALGALLLVMINLPTAEKWRDSLALWSQVHAQYPQDYRPCRNIGNAHFEAERFEDALAQYERCRARYSDVPFDKNIALTLMALSRGEEARPYVIKLIRERPEDAAVRQMARALGMAP